MLEKQRKKRKIRENLLNSGQENLRNTTLLLPKAVIFKKKKKLKTVKLYFLVDEIEVR